MKKEITAEQAKTLAVGMNERGNAHRARWITHLTNRLTYERTMLGESGGLKADKFDLQPGGQICRRGHWFVILKVNRTAGVVRSVTVSGHFSSTVQLEEILDYRAPADGGGVTGERGKVSHRGGKRWRSHHCRTERQAHFCQR